MAIASGRLRAGRFFVPILLVAAPLAWLGFGAQPAGALTGIPVTTNADSGAGSLRAALTSANTTADDVEIDVNAGLGTIALASALPPYAGGTGGTHNLTIKGNGVTLDGVAAASVIEAGPSYSGSIAVDDVMISGGEEGIDGSNSASLTLTNSTITGTVDDGIDASSGSISVTNSTITGTGEDAVDTGSGPVTVIDSAIASATSDGIDSGADTVTVTGSTVSGNGGDGIDTGTSTIDVTNSTIANNLGDGIDTGTSTINLAYDTINNNAAAGFAQLDGGGLAITSFATVITQPGGGNPNCAFEGGLVSQGYNYSDDATCGLTQASDKQSAVEPGLGTLAANGGLGLTMVPNTGSPLINAIPIPSCQTGLASGITTDERGITRPQGSGCDIGAVEVAVAAPAFNPNGYRLVADEGGIFDFGLNFNGSLANTKLNAPIVGLANSPGPDGYLLVGSDGGVFAEGGANFYGSLGGQAIPSPIAAIAAPPSENGYWLVAQNGKTYPFGSAPSLPAVQLPPGARIVGMASTTDGQGAWLTDQFGDVYAEGTAQYVGGLGSLHINAPIVGIAAAASGQGYLLAGADGGVFRYGTQGFFGSVPGVLMRGQHIVAPIVGIAVTHSGNGYWEVGADGGVYAFGDAPFLGSTYTTVPGDKLNGPIVGIQHLGAASG